MTYKVKRKLFWFLSLLCNVVVMVNVDLNILHLQPGLLNRSSLRVFTCFHI